MKNLFKDRKTLYLVLGFVMVSVFTLTVAYAALNTVLTISGNARVTAADWDIYLNNPRVTNGSATIDVPEIKTSSTLEFSTTLNMPGDFYEFTVDVVNGGDIDAMIENVIKTPELTTEQAKFLKYEITYQNGETITTKQTLSKGTTMPIKVRIEYRKDLVASDLPTGQVILDLSLTLEYIQSDGSGSSVNNSNNTLGFPIQWNSKNILENKSVDLGDNVLIGAAKLIKISDFAPTFEQISSSQMTFICEEEQINTTTPIQMNNTYQQNYLTYGTATWFRYENLNENALPEYIFFISVPDINNTGNMAEEIGEIHFNEPGLYVANAVLDYTFEDLPSFDVILDVINN